jgi:hypothetical protein
MSQWHHWPEDIRGKQEAYRSSVWTFSQNPLPYLLIMVLGTWLQSWAIFRMLGHVIGTYAEAKGFADISGAIFMAYLPGMFLGVFVVCPIFFAVALPVSFFTGRDLIFGSAKQSLAIEDDTGASMALVLPLFLGNLLGFVFWIWDLNPLAFVPWSW